MPSIRATRRSRTCARQRRRGWCSRCSATTRRRRSRCRSRARRPARRSPRRRARCPTRAACSWPALLAGAPAGRADGGAHGRPARRLLRQQPLRLQQRPRAHAAPALRQPLAAREEGPGRGALGAGQADRLLARPHHAAEVPRRRSRAGVLEWNKAFERSASRTRSRSQVAARRRRLRHPRRRPRLGPLDDQRRRRRSARSARATSTRAAARSSTPTSASRACRRATSARPRAQVLTDAPASRTAFGAQPLDRPASCSARLRRASATTATMAARADGLRARRARGARRPRSRQPRGASAFVEAYLKDVTMHEVGHTLGLRHNFRASRVYTDAAARRPGVHARATASPAR